MSRRQPKPGDLIYREWYDGSSTYGLVLKVWEMTNRVPSALLVRFRDLEFNENNMINWYGSEEWVIASTPFPLDLV